MEGSQSSAEQTLEPFILLVKSLTSEGLMFVLTRPLDVARPIECQQYVYLAANSPVQPYFRPTRQIPFFCKGIEMMIGTPNKSSIVVSCPPAGSRNIQIGAAVIGPGGRWVPCASATIDGAFLSCVYEVGPGRNQVCIVNRPSYSADDALSYALDLAKIAAA